MSMCSCYCMTFMSFVCLQNQQGAWKEAGVFLKEYQQHLRSVEVETIMGVFQKAGYFLIDLYIS